MQLSNATPNLGSPRPRLLWLGALAAAIEAGHLCLLVIGDLGQGVVELVAIHLATSSFYLFASFLALRWFPVGTGPGARRGLLLIGVAGLVFRATLLPLDPGLSEDLFRYRWQGKLQAAGGDPYRAIPQDARWSGLRDETWPQVTRKDFPSAYGPTLELLFRGWYPVAASVTSNPFRQAWLFKLPFALLELAVGGALLLLLSALGRPRQWVLIYWWSPLPTLEIWGQGHNDSLVVLLTVLALAFAARRGWYAAFALLAAAVMTKFWPIILLPFFGLQREAGRWELRWKPALAAFPLALALAWPYRESLGDVTEVIKGFVGGWRNNDSLFQWIYHWAGEDYRLATKYASRLLALSIGMLWLRRLPLVQSSLWAITLLLALSANCFPWYLTWFLPLLALYPNPALLLWTALAPLSYHIVIRYAALGVWEDSDTFRVLEYAPVAALLVGGWTVAGIKRLVKTSPSDC